MNTCFIKKEIRKGERERSRVEGGEGEKERTGKSFSIPTSINREILLLFRTNN